MVPLSLKWNFKMVLSLWEKVSTVNFDSLFSMCRNMSKLLISFDRTISNPIWRADLFLCYFVSTILYFLWKFVHLSEFYFSRFSYGWIIQKRITNVAQDGIQTSKIVHKFTLTLFWGKKVPLKSIDIRVFTRHQ